MNRDACVDVSRRLLERVASKSSDDADALMHEPASAFLDNERWQRERQLFFLDSPQVVGFAGEVAQPGSYFTTEILQIPIVITRDEQGVLHAFINACAHRGARVVEGSGTGRRLTCRFHGWSYQLDGHLAGRPNAAAFADCQGNDRLRSLPVSDRGGLLVVGANPAMDQAQVDHHLDDIAPALAGLGLDAVHSVAMRQLEVDANWKLVASLSHESYHFATLHRDSLAPMMTSHAVCDYFGRHSRWAFPMKGIAEMLAGPESDWPQRPPGVMNHTLFPGTVMVVPPQDAQLIRVEPGKHPGHSVVYYSGVCSDLARIEQSREAYEFGGDIFEREDLDAAAQCQQGLAAGGLGLVFGRNEPVVQFWHRLWNQALA